MSTAITLINQTIIMFLLAGVGFALFKTRKITPEGSKSLANILIFIVLPCVIINGFLVERTTERMLGLLFSAVGAAVLLGVAIVISRIFFKKDAIAGFSAAFSNAGFIGIPLVQNLLGVEYVFYMSAFLVAFGLMSWTYGLYLISGKADISAKKLLSNPAIMAAIFGMIIFVLRIQLPAVISSTLSTIGNMNTPLGMIILGTYIAKEDIKKVFTSKNSYLVSLVRLILVPLICLFALKFIWVPVEELRMLLLICASAPCGATLAMFSQMCGKDYSYGAQIVSLSTLLCPLTIMGVLTLATLLW